MKILCHFTDFNHRPERRKKNTFGALGYYRIFKVAEGFRRAGHEVDIRGTDIATYGTTFEENWENIFKHYDIVYIMHYLSEANMSAQAYFADKYKKKLIYDIDDNYLDVPDSNPVASKFEPTKRDRAILSASFFFANALSVSTEPLIDRLGAHFRHVHGVEKPMLLVPNMNDINDWSYKPAPKNKNKIVIGYSGSNSHQDDLVMIMPVIDKLLTKYPKLWFEIIGAIDKTKLDNYFRGFKPKNLDRVAMLAATATFWEYPKYLSEQRWDIGIAPLVDSAFTRCKSHIKWMEYSMYKIPTVASRVYPYFMEIAGRKTITDGETGFLATTTKDWEEKLEQLIEDKSLRQRIGQQAYDHIAKEWQYKDFDFGAIVKQIKALK